MEDALGVLIEFRTLFIALLMWIIIYALLVTRGPFKEADAKLNAGISALAAIIVSLSGVVAFAVSYLFTFFGILIVAIFIIAMLLNFLEIDIPSLGLNGKIVMAVFVVLFLGILVNSFFAMNNEFEKDRFNEMEYQSEINTNPNIGFGEFEPEVSSNWFTDLINSVPSATWSAFIFLAVIGVFVIIFAR
ncbi:MAG: hypothetical protein LAT82_01740 [Nanoarchaeota archaeon]|nr:hypothetical protein [Nanoarchaeota archaeon]